jgi:type VI secretion system secreted protein Hcp
MLGNVGLKIDGFLELPDVPGESLRSGHEEQLEIHGIEFNMKAPHDANTKARRGRVQLSTVTILKNYDMGSPYIKQACFQNKKFDPVKIYFRRTIEEESKDYLVVNLTEASIIGYSIRPSTLEPGLLEETVDFAFKEITFTYDDDHEVVMDVHIGV